MAKRTHAFSEKSEFKKTVEQALKLYHKPQKLGDTSPLAAPYLLKNYLAENHSQRDMSDPTQRGHILRGLIDSAIDQGITDPVDQDILHRRFRQQVQAQVIRDSYGLGRTRYNEVQNNAIIALARSLIQRLQPALSPESLRPTQSLINRPEITIEAYLAKLKHHTESGWEAIAITGSGGIGKSTLGNALALAWQADTNTGNAFWFTVRPNITDQLGTLLFSLGHFLHQQSSSSLWMELLANKGDFDLDLILGIVRYDLSQLDRKQALLCIDEVDLLDGARVGHHAQIIAFLNGLHGLVPMIFMGQQVLLEAEEYVELTGLSFIGTRQLLESEQISLLFAELTTIHEYTQGNPRLIELFMALYATGAGMNPLLQELPALPSISFLLSRILQRLDESQRRILLEIAVFPTPAPSDVWQTKSSIIPFNELRHRRLVQDNGAGGVSILPAYREVLIHCLEDDQERYYILHKNAATVRIQRAQYTDALYHLIQANEPEQAILLWKKYQQQEINQGQAARAIGLLYPLKSFALSPTIQDMLTTICAKLDRLNDNEPQALEDLQSAIYNTAVYAAESDELRGIIQNDLGEYESARAVFRNSIVTADEFLFGSRLASIHKGIGWSYLREKELDRAWHEAQIAQYEIENFQGAILEERCEYESAEQHLFKALEIAGQIDHIEGRAKTSNTLLSMYARIGRFDEIERYYVIAKNDFQKLGQFSNLLLVELNRAMAYNQAEQYEKAAKMTQTLLKQFEMVNRADGVIYAQHMLAEAYLGLSLIDEAEIQVTQVLNTEEQWIMPDAMRTYGEILLQRNKVEAAIEWITRAVEAAENAQDIFLCGYGYRALGRAYQTQGSTDAANRSFAEAIDHFDGIKLVNEIEKTRILFNAK